MVENVSPTQAWEALRADPDARLIDVRTDPERAFVGLPDLSEAGKEPVLIPSADLSGDAGRTRRSSTGCGRPASAPEHKLFFICRTGGRSMAAAQAAARAGYPHACNVTDGFEGVPDAQGHRGTVGGWKAEGLPWHQR